MLRTIVLALIACALAAAEAAQEIYTLRDGRELTGVHDAQAGVIRIIEGRISGEVPVKPDDIVARRPLAAATAGDPLPTLTLVLHDGRHLTGRYDERAGRLELLGAVSGSLAITSAEIAERIPYAEPVAPPPPDDADAHRQWWTAELGRRLEALRQREADLVAAAERLKTTRAELARVTTEVALHRRNRDTTTTRYRDVLGRRQAWIDAHPGAPVPEELTVAVATEETLLRELITATTGFATDERNLTTLAATQAAEEELARNELLKQRKYLEDGQAEAARQPAAKP